MEQTASSETSWVETSRPDDAGGNYQSTCYTCVSSTDQSEAGVSICFHLRLFETDGDCSHVGGFNSFLQKCDGSGGVWDLSNEGKQTT